MYSALKKDGIPMYKLARKGEIIDIPEREIEVYSLDLVKPLDKEGNFTIECFVSKGTYIRSLVRDIGEKLGCGAAMAALERTKSGQFSLDTAMTLAELEEKLKEAGDNRDEVIQSIVIPVDKMFSELQELRLLPEWERLIENGNSFEERNLKKEFFVSDRTDKSQYRVYVGKDTFMGVYEFRKEEKKFSPVKMFLNS
jgi:tRNA pseudouridine55 synthase